MVRGKLLSSVQEEPPAHVTSQELQELRSHGNCPTKRVRTWSADLTPQRLSRRRNLLLRKGSPGELSRETSAQAGGSWSSEGSPGPATLGGLLHVGDRMLASSSPAQREDSVAGASCGGTCSVQVGSRVSEQ